MSRIAFPGGDRRGVVIVRGEALYRADLDIQIAVSGEGLVLSFDSARKEFIEELFWIVYS